MRELLLNSMKNEEDQHQIALMDWVRLRKDIEPFIFHIPNGGRRNKREAVKLKKMGVKAGVSDLFFAFPSRNFHGLWIELKSKTGKVTASQKEWLEKMEKAGYAVAVCYGWESAKTVIEAYIND